MTDRVSAAYEARAQQYIALTGEVEQLAPPDRRLVATWRDSTNGQLLDAGCGPGQWTDLLHADGGREVLGLDITSAFIARARRRYPELEFVRASFASVPAPDGTYGGILAWYSLIHTPPSEVPGVLDEFARVLGVGGSLLIGFFDGVAREEFDHAVTTAWFWSIDAMTVLLDAAGFEVVASERRTPEDAEPSSRAHASITAIRRGSLGVDSGSRAGGCHGATSGWHPA